MCGLNQWILGDPAAEFLTKDEAQRIAANIAKLPGFCASREARGRAGLASLRDWSNRDRLDYLSSFIMYEQSPVLMAVFSEFTHDTMPMFPCRLMVRKIYTVRIVKRVIGGADHKMIARHSSSSRFFNAEKIGI